MISDHKQKSRISNVRNRIPVISDMLGSNILFDEIETFTMNEYL